MLPKSLFRFEGGERYLGPICLDKRERFNFGIFSLRRRESAAVAGLFVARRANRRKESFHRRNSLRARGILSLVEQRGRKKRVCVCFPWALFFSKEEEAPPKATLFSSFFS